jgi:cation:H+ antiporter
MISIVGTLICAAVIFFAGKKLAFYGDAIAELSGLGKGWIGLILLATVTSLPELVVSISSSAVIQSSDLVVGNILGSCVFNLFILSILDVFVPHRKPLFGVASPTHILSIGVTIILVAIVGIGIFLPSDIMLTPYIGLTSLAFIILYFVFMNLIYKHDIHTKPTSTTKKIISNEVKNLKKAVLKYTLYSIIIIMAAFFLPSFANQLAEQTGLSKSFMGTLLLATSTSLPEIAVSIAAIRMNATDMSVGNLLGSNIFNIFIIGISEFFYTKGLILKDASNVNLISVFIVIIMSSVAIIGLSYHAQKKRYLMAWDAAIIFILYFVNLLFLA